MARIIVTTDPTTHHASATLLDENVYSMHLETEHSSSSASAGPSATPRARSGRNTRTKPKLSR